MRIDRQMYERVRSMERGDLAKPLRREYLSSLSLLLSRKKDAQTIDQLCAQPPSIMKRKIEKLYQKRLTIDYLAGGYGLLKGILIFKEYPALAQQVGAPYNDALMAFPAILFGCAMVAALDSVGCSRAYEKIRKS